MAANKLTPKQRQFVDEYLIDLNATRAYKRAGYAGSGNTAEVNAFHLLRTHKVSKAIQKALKERSERVKIDADYVLKRLVDIDEMDVSDILDKDCNLLPINQWPKVWRTTISAIDVSVIGKDENESILKKIKWPDKVKNIELLGRHINIRAWDKEDKKPSSDGMADLLSRFLDKMPD